MTKVPTVAPALLLAFALTAPAQQQYPDQRSPDQRYPDQQRYPAQQQQYPDQQRYPSQQRYAETISSGTSISVRTNDTIDMRNSSDGRVFTGVVNEDVRDNNGNVAIPRGANAELIVRNVGPNDMALDLESITVEGRRYIVSTTDQSYNGTEKEGVGKNSRTGKYVGGGALLGTIVGAIAGGGKGAAIGAIAGGAAGAGAQTMTRGSQVRVPAETLLTFRLDRPLTIGRGENSRDNGYDRNGQHFHYRY